MQLQLAFPDCLSCSCAVHMPHLINHQSTKMLCRFDAYGNSTMESIRRSHEKHMTNLNINEADMLSFQYSGFDSHRTQHCQRWVERSLLIAWPQWQVTGGGFYFVNERNQISSGFIVLHITDHIILNEI